MELGALVENEKYGNDRR